MTRRITAEDIESLVRERLADARQSRAAAGRENSTYIWASGYITALGQVLDDIKNFDQQTEWEEDWEWGVKYEDQYTAAHNEAMARRWVDQDDGYSKLLRRRPAGEWEEAE
jgi:hypothetical protein